MEFREWMQDKIDMVEVSLKESVCEKNNPQKLIYEAMNYSLMAGGKRLRPVLMLGAYELFDNEYEKVMPFACAMEMIHTYSLIHDDLPAMDNDDYRRGKLSNHKMFGEAAAILAGDALLNKAFETALHGIIKENIDKDRGINALNCIAQSSGTEGMIGGQVVDMFADTAVHNLEDLQYLHRHKTGAIIKSSVIAGAILGGANDEEIKALELYSEKLGIAFQIEDDILDVEGSIEKLGKPIGSDTENNKKTYVTLFGLEESKCQVEKLTKEAEKSLSLFGEKSVHLVELAKYLTNRDH